MTTPAESNVHIRPVRPEEHSAAFGLMLQLRPRITRGEFDEVLRAAATEGSYTLWGAYGADGRLLGLAGWRVLTDFVHGRHLYVDDLVTSESVRSQGIGALLLRALEKQALERDCRGLRLCTGVENEAGKRFYEREGWSLRAVAYKKKVGPTFPG